MQPEKTVMNENAQRLVVVDLRIPFIRLVLFFVKAALAAIPAAIIAAFIVMVVAAIVTVLVGDLGLPLMRHWSSF
jgi:hypothetical protein